MDIVALYVPDVQSRSEFYLSLPTVGPYWLRLGAQTSQSALEKKCCFF